MSTRFFILCLSVAAIFTMVKYVLKVEGTVPEKVRFLWDTSERVMTGIEKYVGRHRFNKRLPVMYGHSGLAA